MNWGAGEPLDELEVQFCLLHRHQKRQTVLFIFNLDETARQTMTDSFAKAINTCPLPAQTIFKKLKASAHSFKSFTSRLLKLSFSLSMHLLPRMNAMLDFIWPLPVQLRGTRNKWTFTKNLIHCRFRTSNTTRPPDYKSTVLTTRLPITWYESELNVHEIYYR